MKNEETTEKELVKELDKEIKKEEKEIQKLSLNVRVLTILACLLVAIAIGLFAYLHVSSQTVYIEKSEVYAPDINLAAQSSGLLEQVFVEKGAQVSTGNPVARVGNELVKAKTSGIITKADAVTGTLYNPGQTVVSMIDPSDLRIVGHIDENKGLDQISVGQYATFTVDAFGSKQYEGVVDEVSPVSREGDVVFNISDKREVKVFDVKVRFDTVKYPELKDGMSARLWIYVK